MAALTLDHLSGGRFVLGLGASGPQVVEGWYGQPYPRPLARTREFVAIVRQVLAREAPVTFDGQFYRLPLPADEGAGPRQGAALDRAPAAGRPADPPGGRGPAQHRDDGRDRRRLAPAVLLPAHGRRVPRRCSPRASPSASGPDRRLRGRRDRARRARRRRRVRRRPGPPVHRPVRGRHGRQGRQLPPRRAGPARVRARRATRSRRTTWPATARARPRPCRSSWSGTSRSSARADDIRAQLPAWQATAITTMLVQADPRTLPGDRGRPGADRLTSMDDDYAEAVLDLVAQIPPGRAMTYGLIAEIVGDRFEAAEGRRRGGPRQVGTVLGRTGSDVPWWRVVNTVGTTAGAPPAACPRGAARRAHAAVRGRHPRRPADRRSGFRTTERVPSGRPPGAT